MGKNIYIFALWYLSILIVGQKVTGQKVTEEKVDV